MMKKIMVGLTLILLLSACGGTSDGGNGNTNSDTGQPAPSSAATPTPAPSPTVTESTGEDEKPAAAANAQEAAAAVMLALKHGDMAKLAELSHPDKGLLFSPYAHIDTAAAKVFPADALPGMDDETVYSWGSYDGSGEPIELTFKQYYDKFVYDKNFIEPETVGINEIQGMGTAAVNIQEVFPDGFIMDYYFSGFDPQYEGMDWESLILVLEESDGAWYASAIVHSQWTI